MCGLFSGCSKQRLLCSCGAWVSHFSGFSCFGVLALDMQAPIVVAHGLSCSNAHGIFPDQGLNLCLLHLQVGSLPLSHQGALSTKLNGARDCLRREVFPASFAKRLLVRLCSPSRMEENQAVQLPGYFLGGRGRPFLLPSSASGNVNPEMVALSYPSSVLCHPWVTEKLSGTALQDQHWATCLQIWMGDRGTLLFAVIMWGLRLL